MSSNRHIDSILDRVDRQTGMTVPDGYFESFAARMKDSLPEQPWEKESSGANVLPRSVWQRVRPYVYMAAMFAGIWLLMNISTILGTGGNITPADLSPASPSLAEFMDSDDNIFAEYAVEAIDTIDIYNSLYDEGFDPVNLSYNQ